MMTNERQRAELLPCPFCGHEAIMQEHPPHKHSDWLVKGGMPEYSPGSFTIECVVCECGMIHESRDGVVAAWNRRAALQSQPAGGYPCKIVEADFEAGTVTLQMDGQFTVSAGQKYLCDYALKSQDKEDAQRYRRLRKGDIDDVAVVRGLGAMDYGASAVIATYSDEIDGDDLDSAIDHARRVEENK